MLLFFEDTTTLSEFDQLGTSYGEIVSNLTSAFKKGITQGFETGISTLTAMNDSALKLQKTIGSGVVMSTDQFRNRLIDSYLDVVKMGGSVTDVTDAMSELATESGKIVQPSFEVAKQMVALSKTTGLATKELGKMEGAFLRLTKSQTKSAEKMAEIAKIARQSGLDASQLLQNVNKNLQLVDSYAFKGGVDGLTKMSTQAQLLGVEIGDIISEQKMEDLLDPEKAIELAQNLSMIGGFSSDLTNFQQILNKGRNDVGGLQDSFIKLAESAFKVNEATGEITIDSLQRDRLRASVEAIGGDYKKFVQIGREAAKQTAISNKLITAGFDSKISPESMNLVKSLTEIGKGGKLELKIPGFETNDLVKTLQNNPAALEQALKDYKDKADLSDRQLAEQTLGVQESTQRDARIIRDVVLKSLSETERNNVLTTIKEGQQSLFEGTQNVANGLKDIPKGLLTNTAELRTMISNTKGEIDRQKPSRSDTEGANLPKAVEAKDLLQEDAFFGEGKKMLSLGKGEMFDFIKDDQAIFAPDLDKKIGLLTETYMNASSFSDTLSKNVSLKGPEEKTLPLQQIVTKQETSQNITQTVDNNFNISVDLNVKGLTSGPLAEILTRDAEFQRSLKNKVMEIFSQKNLLSKSKTRFES
jgi:hypothetical protein